MGLAAQTAYNRAVILQDSCSRGYDFCLDIHVMLVIRSYLTVKKLSILVRLPHLFQTPLEHFLQALPLFGCLIPAGHRRWRLHHDQPSCVVVVKAGIDIRMSQLEFIHVAAFWFRHRIRISSLEIPAIGKVPVRVRATDVILVDQSIAVIVVSF